MRGSIPSPGPSTKLYGGNTSCVHVRCGDEHLIFDLGTGVRALGDTLGPGPLRATIFLSHYHYDHLQGLPFFTPMFDPANAFTLYGPEREGQGVREILGGQMVQPYFPVSAENAFRAQIDYRHIVAEHALAVGEAQVRTIALNHPGGTLGYRVDYRGRSLVYATDIEHGTVTDVRLTELSRGADLLIYDAMYTPAEYEGAHGKRGWGHSTWEAGVRVANAAEVKTLMLFHHDPARDDRSLTRLLAQVRRKRRATVAAKEREVIRL